MCVCVSHMCACVGVCDASAYCSATKSDAIQGVEPFCSHMFRRQILLPRENILPAFASTVAPFVHANFTQLSAGRGTAPLQRSYSTGGEAKKDLAEELHEYFTVDLLFFDENLLLPPWMDA